MSIVYVLLPIALVLGAGFVISFAMAAKSGQYDDLETPAHRMLLDDDSSADRPAARRNERNRK